MHLLSLALLPSFHQVMIHPIRPVAPQVNADGTEIPPFRGFATRWVVFSYHNKVVGAI